MLSNRTLCCKFSAAITKCTRWSPIRAGRLALQSKFILIAPIKHTLDVTHETTAISGHTFTLTNIPLRNEGCGPLQQSRQSLCFNDNYDCWVTLANNQVWLLSEIQPSPDWSGYLGLGFTSCTINSTKDEGSHEIRPQECHCCLEETI